MSFDDLVKKADERKAAGKKQEEEEAAKEKNVKKEQAISNLKKLLADCLPTLIKELEPVVYNFDEGGGAFAEFALKDKKFLLYTEMRAGASGQGNMLVLATREGGKNRAVGS